MGTRDDEQTKRTPVRITGYAIVSEDDKIAAADGLVPPSLRNEKDWEYYQRALAGSDLIVSGHRSHDLEPNIRGDMRLVVSRHADGLERRADGWWWSPTRVSWDEVVKRLLPRGGDVAAPGGEVVFDLFLKIGYDEFHLSRVHGVKLPGGRAIFSDCGTGLSAETILAKTGLRLAQTIPLDPDHGVDMDVWRAARELAQAPSA